MAALFEEQRKLLNWISGRSVPAKLRELERRGFALRGHAPREAVRILRRVLECDPDRITSLRACGRVLLQLREYDKALPLWEHLATLTPQEIEPHLQQARIHLRANRLRESELHAGKVLAINPLHSEGRSIQARATGGVSISPTAATIPVARLGPSPTPLTGVPRSGNEGMVAQLKLILMSAARPFVRGLQKARARPKTAQPEGALPHQAIARRPWVDSQVLIATADEQSKQGDIASLIETLDDLAGLLGPVQSVTDVLARYRPTIDSALDGAGFDANTKFMLTVRARRLWTFLPKPTSSTEVASSDTLPAQWTDRRFNPASLLAAAEEHAQQGDIPGLIDSLDDLVGITGPLPVVIDALARHRQLIDSALARADGGLETKVRLVLTVRVRRLWAFLPRSAIEPDAGVQRLDPPSLIAEAEILAEAGDMPRLIETLDVLAGVAGPQPNVIEILGRYRPVIDGALARTDGVLDTGSRAMLSVRARRLWSFLPHQPTENAAPKPFEPTQQPQQLDPPSLIAASQELAQAGDIPRLVETLDVLAGVAGPQPFVVEALAQHRPAIDAALARNDSDLDVATRAMLSVRTRRLWTFLPNLPAEIVAPVAIEAAQQRFDPPSLVAAAENHARIGDIPRLVETLDVLAGVAGAQPVVIDALARHRSSIDAALGRSDGALDAGARAMLSVRTRRLWAILPDRSTEVVASATTEPAQQPQRLDPAALLAFAKEAAATGDIPRLVEMLDVLAGVAGPQPILIEALARYRPTIDIALIRGDSTLDSATRVTLSVRVRRLWAFLPHLPGEIVATAPVEPTSQPQQFDLPSLIAVAAELAANRDIPRLIETLDVLAGVAGPQPVVIEALTRHRWAIDTTLARSDGVLDASTRAMLSVRARRLWAFLPDLPLDTDHADSTGVRQQPQAMEPPSLIAKAQRFSDEGNIESLIETLDMLTGMGGPQPVVIEALARHRPVIDAFLRSRDAKLDPALRATLSARARRLWTFLTEPPTKIAAIPSAPITQVSTTLPASLPDVPSLIASARELADRGDIAKLLEALGEIAGIAGPQPAVIETLSRHRPTIDAALVGTDGDLDSGTRSMLRYRARRLWAFLPDTTIAAPSKELLRQTKTTARPSTPPATRSRNIDAATWLEAARLAARAEDRESVISCCRDALKAASADRDILREVTSFLAECGMQDEVVAIWRSAYAQTPGNLLLALNLLRAIEVSAQPEFIFGETGALIAGMPRFGDLNAANQNSVVEIFRRLAGHLDGKGLDARLDAFEGLLTKNQEPSALLSWALGTIDIWRYKRNDALAHFDQALTQPDLAAGSSLNLHAEKALLHARYHHYGEAFSEISQVPKNVFQSNTYYLRRLSPVLAVAEFCPEAPRPLRYPECLIDVIVDELMRQPIRYEARSRHVAMVSGSLGQGGGERQTITVVKQVITDERVEKLTLLVRSTHLRPTDDFFLPLVSELPLDCYIYGKDWYTSSDIGAVLPELKERPRLSKAIDLLPQTIREDVVRLCRHIFDVRPQAVHIWQDITGAALACLISGVPNFFVHRGSLSPDYWGQTDRQTETHFRPMRHTYRRLLELPNFVILNNSLAGCRTDRNWTGWPDEKPFHVLANAIDFSLLGENVGRNVELRRSLGISDDAIVVGGSFRIFSVKRPQFWIAAARLIALAIPQAHFLIIGDGDMTDLVRERAREYGIEDRLHLPGRVSNVGDWYRTMDVSLLTSEREGIPNAIIEAQHFGVPIVATDVGGIRESIAEGESGYVVPGNSPDEYAERVIAILLDAPWRERAALLAPGFVHQKFSLERVVDRLMRYYGIGPVQNRRGSITEGHR